MRPFRAMRCPMGNAVPTVALHLVLSAALAASAGCRNRGQEGDRAQTPGAAPAGTGPARAPAPSPAPSPVKPAMQGPARVDIPFISDDYAGALARARAEKKPLFIDMWAPWCHTCLSMKQFVMVDPSLAPYLDRFVWLEIDTDRPVNAALLTRLEVNTWPTFYVLTPEGESVEARHLGAASIAQLRELLDQGEAGHQDAMAAAGKLPSGSAMALVRAGDRAAAARDYAAADKAYDEALATAPHGWSRTADVLVKQIAARYRGGNVAGCAELGMRDAGRAGQGHTASVTDFAFYADACAD